MPRQRHERELPLSDAPRSTRHLDPYTTEKQEDGHERLPKAGDWIPVSDGKSVPGFQMRSSTGPLWQALSRAPEEEMKVISVKRNQEFKGLKHVTVVECELPGFDYNVLAYYKGGRRVA